eukprot:scaffold87377_cov63-Phaeocystis_antarctica.AAC.3
MVRFGGASASTSAEVEKAKSPASHRSKLWLIAFASQSGKPAAIAAAIHSSTDGLTSCTGRPECHIGRHGDENNKSLTSGKKVVRGGEVRWAAASLACVCLGGRQGGCLGVGRLGVGRLSAGLPRQSGNSARLDMRGVPSAAV